MKELFVGNYGSGPASPRGNPGDLLKVKHTLEKIKELAEREAGHR